MKLKKIIFKFFFVAILSFVSFNAYAIKVDTTTLWNNFNVINNANKELSAKIKITTKNQFNTVTNVLEGNVFQQNINDNSFTYYSLNNNKNVLLTYVNKFGLYRSWFGVSNNLEEIRGQNIDNKILYTVIGYSNLVINPSWLSNISYAKVDKNFLVIGTINKNKLSKFSKVEYYLNKDNIPVRVLYYMSSINYPIIEVLLTNYSIDDNKNLVIKSIEYRDNASKEVSLIDYSDVSLDEKNKPASFDTAFKLIVQNTNEYSNLHQETINTVDSNTNQNTILDTNEATNEAEDSIKDMPADTPSNIGEDALNNNQHEEASSKRNNDRRLEDYDNYKEDNLLDKDITKDYEKAVKKSDKKINAKSFSNQYEGYNDKSNFDYDKKKKLQKQKELKKAKSTPVKTKTTSKTSTKTKDVEKSKQDSIKENSVVAPNNNANTSAEAPAPKEVNPAEQNDLGTANKEENTNKDESVIPQTESTNKDTASGGSDTKEQTAPEEKTVPEDSTEGKTQENTVPETSKDDTTTAPTDEEKPKDSEIEESKPADNTENKKDLNSEEPKEPEVLDSKPKNNEATGEDKPVEEKKDKDVTLDSLF